MEKKSSMKIEHIQLRLPTAIHFHPPHSPTSSPLPHHLSPAPHSPSYTPNAPHCYLERHESHSHQTSYGKPHNAYPHR